VAALLSATLVVVALAAPALADRQDRYEQTARDLRFADRLTPLGERSRTEVVRRQIAPGLTFVRIVDRKIPRRIFVLRADVAHQPLTFDVTLAGESLPARATTSAMARRHGAIAAINGDFSDRTTGRPIHPFVGDGVFVHAPVVRGTAFVVPGGESGVAVARPEQTVVVEDPKRGLSWTVDRWNMGDPTIGEIAGYSLVGGTLSPPPAEACSIHLDPTGRVAASSPTGLERTYVVDQRACAAEPMDVGLGVVLSAIAGTHEATQLLATAVGTSLTIRWDTGFADAFDMLGGGARLVADGEVAVAPDCQVGSCHADPRTGIGVLEDGRLLLVVVDGRRRHYSIGLSTRAFARLMRRLGAEDAVNLDGGGSSTMVIEGEVVNRPSDGHERPIGNAALILPGPDPGE
jgi:hypothetical protein